MFRSLLVSAILCGGVRAAVASAPPTATIAAGTLTGGVCASSPGAVYFKSIPFALPPTGSRRLAAPQPYNKTYPGGHLDASTAAPSCIQFGAQFAEQGATSEDCLYLDIWAPAGATKDSALPVRFWVFGGADIAGGISDPTYDGCAVPSTDAIMVSANYRVGPLGFLTLDRAGVAGNQGIQDLLLALEWVQENIAAFGGDPAKVMMHGQSAGATNAYTIAALPQARRLVSSAIFESGGGRDPLQKSTAEDLGVAFTQALNCSTGIGDHACLQQASIAEFQQVFNTLPLLYTNPYASLLLRNRTTPSFQPHVDGTVIPCPSSERGTRVPSVFGSNAEEGTIFVLGQFAAMSNGTGGNPAAAVTEADYVAALEQSFGPANAKLIEQSLPVSAYNATPFPAYFALANVVTLNNYECPAYRGLNTAVANHIPVWAYRFAHAPSCSWSALVPAEALPLVGATHEAEIPFVFGTTTHLPRPNGTCSFTPDEVQISTFLLDAWTHMAAAQRPTTRTRLWPPYVGPKQPLGINIVNTTTSGTIDFTGCELFDKINAELSG